VAGIGIHGTNAPSSIFRAATHGCIRLHPDDIARLFDQISAGMRGRIIYEPVLLAVVDGRVYLEVARDVYRRAPGDVASALRLRAESAGIAGMIDWVRADIIAVMRDGIARDVTRDDLPLDADASVDGLDTRRGDDHGVQIQLQDFRTGVN
jgi:L,D-transpeptidase ErfK/SrfK